MSIFFQICMKSQSYQILNRVWIPESAKIKKKVVTKNCPSTAPANSTVITSTTHKLNGETFTVTSASSPATITEDKTFEIDLKDLTGRANLVVDEDDKSMIHVNFWLNPTNKLKRGTKVNIISRSINCAKQLYSSASTYTLINDTTLRLWRIDAGSNETSTDWFKKARTIIEVYKGSIIDYYLVDKYERETDYYFTLPNREFISYKNRSRLDIGAVTIPFKYRPGFTKKVNDATVKVDPEFTADLNLGIFLGPTWGRYRMRLERKELKELAKLKSTIGLFGSFSTTSIDASSTSAAKSPLKDDEKKTIGVISYGVGYTGSIYNWQVGAFIGWDSATGEYSGKWNFNNKLWVGFGLFYNISGFWKKD